MACLCSQVAGINSLGLHLFGLFCEFEMGNNNENVIPIVVFMTFAPRILFVLHSIYAQNCAPNFVTMPLCGGSSSISMSSGKNRGPTHISEALCAATFRGYRLISDHSWNGVFRPV